MAYRAIYRTHCGPPDADLNTWHVRSIGFRAPAAAPNLVLTRAPTPSSNPAPARAATSAPTPTPTRAPAPAPNHAPTRVLNPTPERAKPPTPTRAPPPAPNHGPTRAYMLQPGASACMSSAIVCSIVFFFYRYSI